MRASLPASVELDDLVQAGCLGLLDAADKYDRARQTPFRAYAKHRIRGAMLDSLRGLDRVSRDLRKRASEMEDTAQQLASTSGREPDEEGCAARLGISLDEFRRRQAELHSAGLVRGHSFRVEDHRQMPWCEPIADRAKSPEFVSARVRLRELLEAVLDSLPTQGRIVISRYYFDEWTMKQISLELGVNESRVSQIHKRAIERLSAALGERGFAAVGPMFLSAN